MKYHGIVSACEVKARCGNGRFKAFFMGIRYHRGKRVKCYELIEYTDARPVQVTRSNMQHFHRFFTQPQYI